MNIRKYFWNLNQRAMAETERILKRPESSEFPAKMYTILSRTTEPKEIFSIISKNTFVEQWPKIRQHWNKTRQSSDFRAWWETVYEQLLGKATISFKEPSGAMPKEIRNIGIMIKNQRVSKNWTQADFARRCGLEQPDISAIEKGRKNMTIGTLIKICRILDIKNIDLAG